MEENENKSRKKSKNNKKVKSKNKKLSKTSVLKIFIVFFVAISIIFIAARMIGGVTLTSIAGEIKVFFQSLGWGDGYPYKTSGEPSEQILIDGGRLFVFSKDKTLLLSSTAKEITEIPVEYGNPAIKYKNKKAIIYDRDSSKMRIQSTSSVICEKEADGTILAAAIGKKGNFAVATQGKNSVTNLKVYNKKQEEIFKWEFNGEKVTDIDLSNDGKYAAVSTILSKNAQVNSKVYVFKFDCSDYISCFDFENSAVVCVRYDKSHNIEIISNTGRGYISDNSTLGDMQNFNPDILFKYSKSEKNFSAVALKKYGGDNFGTVMIYKGESLQYTISIDKEIKDVFCTDKYTAVLTTSSVMVYKNSNGELIKEIQADLSISEIAVKDKKVYMMSPTEILCEKF